MDYEETARQRENARLYTLYSVDMQPSQLRARRMALQFTQAQLAERLGVSANTVARWERGDAPIANPRMLHLSLCALEQAHGAVSVTAHSSERLNPVRA